MSRGPKLTSPLPWVPTEGDNEEDNELCWTDGAGGLPPANREERDAILHRVNGWDALCDDAERLLKMKLGVLALADELASNYGRGNIAKDDESAMVATENAFLHVAVELRKLTSGDESDAGKH